MIDLGLSRITALLRHSPQSWRAVHVAGTNGKGSICAYVTAMLRAQRVSCGAFTSPHLVDRWDCIMLDGQPVSETLFLTHEARVRQRATDLSLQPTEFELLAATAFEIFESQRIQVGVVEVGLGGRLDATNAMLKKHVAVVSKIGLDHQGFLGDTIEAIALQKAGIMRSGVPCVIDASNPSSVLDVLRRHAQETGASPFILATPEDNPLVRRVGHSGTKLEPHQRQNLACAHEVFSAICPEDASNLEALAPAVEKVVWPGRLQSLHISSITSAGRQEPILLDGAHNPQSADVLARYVDTHLRPSPSTIGDNLPAERPVTWVLAASQGKDVKEILPLLLRPGDRVAAVEFGPVDGMPWVAPMPAAELLDIVRQYSIEEANTCNAHGDLELALAWATEAADNATASAQPGPLVVAGSLYLVSDLLRLLKSKEP